MSWQITQAVSSIIIIHCSVFIFKAKRSTIECRYVVTADEALSVYSQLCNKLTSSSHNMTKVRRPPCTGIGSEKFQKVEPEALFINYKTDGLNTFRSVIPTKKHIKSLYHNVLQLQPRYCEGEIYSLTTIREFNLLNIAKM